MKNEITRFDLTPTTRNIINTTVSLGFLDAVSLFVIGRNQTCEYNFLLHITEVMHAQRHEGSVSIEDRVALQRMIDERLTEIRENGRSLDEYLSSLAAD